MRNLMFVSMVAVALAATPSFGDYYLAGDFNGWNAAGNAMTDMGGGIWEADLAGIGAGRHEFKITMGDWGWSYPGPNSWLYADGSGNATIRWDVNTGISDGWSPTENRIGGGDPGAWTAVGSFNGWNNADPATALVAQGGGIYKLTTVLAPGNYEWKAVATGSWDSISWDNRSVNTGNWGFSTDAVNNTVTFWVDAAAGTARIDVTPEPATIGLLLIGAAFIMRRRCA